MQISEHANIKTILDLNDIVFLNKYHSKHLKVTQFNDREVELSANSYVGKILLPSRGEIYIKPKIKINNLLFIISYTYDLVSFKYTENKKLTQDDSLIEIYVIVLLNWLENLFKKGLFKSYKDFTEELTNLKGKIRINENLIRNNKLICEFHDISFSNIENQIIKATLFLILSQKEIAKEKRQRALSYYRMLHDISGIQLTNSSFKKINIHRLNNYYKPILELCELIFKNLRITDDMGNSVFSGFIVNMNSIYEKFLLKALHKRMTKEHVSKSIINNWAKSNDNYLPQIELDILVKNKAIIDAKYYPTPFTKNGKYKSDHIYQILTYLKAYKMNKGFLVYPEPETGEVESTYYIDGMSFNIMSIPLNRDIKDIEKALDKLKDRILNMEIMD